MAENITITLHLCPACEPNLPSCLPHPSLGLPKCTRRALTDDLIPFPCRYYKHSRTACSEPTSVQSVYRSIRIIPWKHGSSTKRSNADALGRRRDISWHNRRNTPHVRLCAVSV